MAATIDAPLGLMFHRFHNDAERPLGQGSIPESRLAAILDGLNPRDVLTPDEWIGRVRDGSLRREHRCITFDDGLLSQYEVALPLLAERGFRAFWFVYSSVFEGEVNLGEVLSVLSTRAFETQDDFVAAFRQECLPGELAALATADWQAYRSRMSAQFPMYSAADLEFRFLRNTALSAERLARITAALCDRAGTTLRDLAASVWMTNDHLADLEQRGHRVGLHSYSHPFIMSALDRATQMGEYQRNAEHIERVTGRRPASMSHPLGSYNADTLSVLREVGVECGFCCSPAVPAGSGRLNATALELARVDGVHL